MYEIDEYLNLGCGLVHVAAWCLSVQSISPAPAPTPAMPTDGAAAAVARTELATIAKPRLPSHDCQATIAKPRLPSHDCQVGWAYRLGLVHACL
ncbi:hypothetical protein E6O75_ATG08479 [Venturia nashicola]|uniref:Uncharacterized protein n=1 Tax=Venturia nashicola TaxID=86259 RepID=A0A4Z1P1E7_9PEZI|nr:hypothetical protein E6O75_ATG08479 [Venturia nashicola]